MILIACDIRFVECATQTSPNIRPPLQLLSRLEQVIMTLMSTQMMCLHAPLALQLVAGVGQPQAGLSLLRIMIIIMDPDSCSRSRWQTHACLAMPLPWWAAMAAAHVSQKAVQSIRWG